MKKRFGKLRVFRQVEDYVAGSGQARPRWLCICNCGKIKAVAEHNLLNGSTNSCGCSRITHGLSRHPLYRVWQAMIVRCSVKCSPKSHHRYYGRGIIVCKAWNNPNTFLSWALNNGWEPGLQIDRRDNDGNYSPDNCRFVTPLVNANNK